MSANVQTMFYTGQRPWHGLGTELKQAATAAEAIDAAGLNWDVRKQKIYVRPNKESGATVLVPDQFAMVRSDNGQPFSRTVGTKYRPLQNKEAFSFFDSVVGEKAAIYHTAGALGRGEKVWILAKLPGDVRIKGTDDVTEKFLLLYNSHDGSSSVQIKMTPVRVVCQNTLGVAMAGKNENTAKIVHSTNMKFKVKDVRKKLQLVSKWFDQFDEQANFLASKQVSGMQAEKFLDMIGEPRIVVRGDKEKVNPRRGEILNLFQSGKGNSMKGVKGTYWALVNGVSEWTDHHRTTRVVGVDPKKKTNRDVTEARWTSQMFGDGSRVKIRSWDAALELAK